MGRRHNTKIGYRKYFLSSDQKARTGKMKLVFVAALVVMTVGGISAAVIPDSQEMEERAWCDALECQIMDKVIDGLKKIHAGKRMEERAWCDAIECKIMDIVIAALKPVLAKFKDIIHDSKKTLTEKVQEVWEHAKDALKPIISLVGNVEKTKEILRKFIAKLIAFDSPGGIAGRSLEVEDQRGAADFFIPNTSPLGKLIGKVSGRSLEMETANEKRKWCDAIECEILDAVVDGLKKVHNGKRMEERAWCD